MSPSAIVIHFHVFKNPSFRFIPSPELIPVDQFDLERVEKTLCDGIIPAIALPAHTSQKFVLRQYRLKVIAGILAATVGMTYKAFVRTTLQDGLPHGLGNQSIGDSFIHRKSHDSSRE